MICERCGNKIIEKYQHETHVTADSVVRSCVRYGKVKFWRPEEIKQGEGHRVLLCAECFSDLEEFFGDFGVWEE